MSYGVWLVGAAGNVGACTIAGWAAVARGLLPPTGLVTFAPALAGLPLGAMAGVPFGGHEVAGARSLRDAIDGLVAERVLPAGLAVDDALEAAQRELRVADTIAQIRADLAAFRDRHRLERVIVVNVASTEAPAEIGDDLDAAPPSVRYAAAALDLGMGFVNFTPSIGSDVPALHALALERGAVHAGADGKTGQTLVKTALAPLFAIRRLPVTSWVSHNVLGNDDGKNLHDPARRSSKQRSKGAALAAILGYAPDAHVGIDYVPSYGDWKVAWDRIVFEGFGGASMSLELTWRGSDTSLAAPLCIDLVRLAELAQRRGDRGVLAHLGLFFKSPLGSSEHRLERQWQALVHHLGIPDGGDDA